MSRAGVIMPVFSCPLKLVRLEHSDKLCLEGTWKACRQVPPQNGNDHAVVKWENEKFCISLSENRRDNCKCWLQVELFRFKGDRQSISSNLRSTADRFSSSGNYVWELPGGFLHEYLTAASVGEPKEMTFYVRIYRCQRQCREDLQPTDYKLYIVADRYVEDKSKQLARKYDVGINFKWLHV